MERESPPSIVEVYRSVRRDCLRKALVLDAVGIPYEIRGRAEEHSILVRSSDAARARDEIETYARENPPAPPAAPTLAMRSSGWAGVFGYAVVMAIGFALQQSSQLGEAWFDQGKTHAALIRHGELWRTATALTLHSDFAHLIANVVAGSLIGVFAGQLLGSGLAWFSILLAGAGGNLLNALIRDGTHTSVGASTAVFAALGLVAAYAWIRRAHGRTSRLARFAPIVGAMVLLGYLGTGGERTDVLAHIAGFVAGIVLGAVYGKLGDRVLLGRRMQFAMGAAAIGILAAAWAMAYA